MVRTALVGRAVKGEVIKDIVTRFAPSPNGLLHLGHAYSAIYAHDFAREKGGRFQLRIEDIDGVRSQDELVSNIYEDLKWLGLQWDGEVVFQSGRFADYKLALDRLKQSNMLYPCFCSRKDIQSALQIAPTEIGPDGMIYPGTCCHISEAQASERMATEQYSLRLRVDEASRLAGLAAWVDTEAGLVASKPQMLGDVVLAPKEIAAAYHLAVTVDDARDGITHVTRGMDLFAATHIHVLLQKLLNLPQPIYAHHPVLIEEENGRKLSKSRDSSALKTLREAGADGPALAANLRKHKFPIGIALGKAY